MASLETPPPPDALSSMLTSCSQLTLLHFTYAVAYWADAQLIAALAGLRQLEDMQINSFDFRHLLPDCLRPLAALSNLRAVELSGINRQGKRCDSDVFHMIAVHSSWPCSHLLVGHICAVNCRQLQVLIQTRSSDLQTALLDTKAQQTIAPDSGAHIPSFLDRPASHVNR